MIFFTTATHGAHFDEEEHGVDDSVLEEGFGDDVADDDDLETSAAPAGTDAKEDGTTEDDEEDANDLLAELEEDADEVVNDSYDDQDDI